jgi:hypothetical protein
LWTAFLDLRRQTDRLGALTSDDVTNKLSDDLRSRALDVSTTNTMRHIRSTAAVADITGEPFDQIPYKQPRIARPASGMIFGRAMGAAGFALDIPVALAAYRSFRDGNFDELAQTVYGDN